MSRSNKMQKCICENPDCINSNVDIPVGEPLICPECGNLLRKLPSEPAKGMGVGIILAIVGGAVLLLGGGFAAWYFLAKDKVAAPAEDIEEVVEVAADDAEGEEDTLIAILEDEEASTSEENTVYAVDDNVAETETPASQASKVDQQKPATDNGKTKTTTKKAGKSTIKTKNGTYVGPTSGGKAHGFGDFTFSRKMSVPLNDGYGTVIEVVPGDRVVSAKFTDGKLRQGKFIFSDGRQPKDVMGISVSL